MSWNVTYPLLQCAQSAAPSPPRRNDQWIIKSHTFTVIAPVTATTPACSPRSCPFLFTQASRSSILISSIPHTNHLHLCTSAPHSSFSLSRPSIRARAFQTFGRRCAPLPLASSRRHKENSKRDPEQQCQTVRLFREIDTGPQSVGHVIVN